MTGLAGVATIARRSRWTLLFSCLGILAGCTHLDVLKLHYLNGFVPGSHAIFEPREIGVMPVDGDLASGTHEIGAIHNAGGKIEKRLAVADAGALISRALISALNDAGLKPVAPEGDVSLMSEIKQISVEKKFENQQTLHGQYFTMHSRVRLRFKLRNRKGDTLYEDEIIGVEDEPPKPVGGEVFFPLETDPAESLSVAFSRAIGQLLVQPKFRHAVESGP
jgi:hypothetical protein